MSIIIDGTNGITLPSGAVSNTTGTVVGTTDTQTLTNKTLTSPTITTPTISGDATISGLTVGKGSGSVVTNTAVGANALNNNSTGAGVTAIGSSALLVNTASNNTAVGRVAGTSTTSGSDNAFFGMQSGYTNVTGVSNVYVGISAGYTATGSYNTFVGQGSGETISSGAKNSILGRYNGNQGGLDIRTASNYIVLSDGDGNPRAWIGAGNNNDLFRVGTTSTSTAGWMHQISYSQTSRYALAVTNDTSAANPSGLLVRYPNSSGASNTDYLFTGENSGGLRAGFYNNGGLSNYSGNNNNLSDRREKTNFAPAKSYLNTICSIPVQTFNYIDQDLENDPGLTLGVVAQDVQAVAPELITETNWGSKEEPKMRLSIYQTDLQFALMKSIQELKAIVDAQAAEIAELKTKVM